MNIAVTGHKGKLGSRLVNLGMLPVKSDITDEVELRRELNSLKPDLLVHAAGISQIAKCEQDYEKAILVNTRGTAHVFSAMADIVGDGRCILLSSEQVFDGQKGCYVESDEPNPINNYGHTKFAAEGLSEIYDNKTIRLSRGVDIHEKDISEYLAQLEKGEKIYVPNFLVRSYAHLDFVALGIAYFANHFYGMPRLLHLGGSDCWSFCEFMFELAKALDLDTNLVQDRQHEESFSVRPLRCGLDVSEAERVGVPIFTPQQTIEEMRKEWVLGQPS